MAILAPILVLLLLGIFEFGRAVMVQQILTNASREGARRAIIEGATTAGVQGVVSSYLGNSTISAASASVTVSPDPSTVGFGTPVTVSVSIPFSSVSWLPAPWFLDEATLSAQTVMLGERPE